MALYAVEADGGGFLRETTGRPIHSGRLSALCDTIIAGLILDSRFIEDGVPTQLTCGHVVFAEAKKLHGFTVVALGWYYSLAFSALDAVRARMAERPDRVAKELESWGLYPRTQAAICALLGIARVADIAAKQGFTWTEDPSKPAPPVTYPTEDRWQVVAAVIDQSFHKNSTDARGTKGAYALPRAPKGRIPESAHWIAGVQRIGVINGDVTKNDDEQQKIAALFNGIISGTRDAPIIEQPPELDIIIAGPQAYEGIDLQVRACAVHHLDLPWTPSIYTQRNGRAVRQGAFYGVVDVYAYLTEGTVDFYRLGRMQGRRAWLDEALGSGRADVNLSGTTLEEQLELIVKCALPEQQAAVALRLGEQVKRLRELKMARESGDIVANVQALLNRSRAVRPLLAYLHRGTYRSGGRGGRRGRGGGRRDAWDSGWGSGGVPSALDNAITTLQESEGRLAQRIGMETIIPNWHAVLATVRWLIAPGSIRLDSTVIGYPALLHPSEPTEKTPWVSQAAYIKEAPDGSSRLLEWWGRGKSVSSWAHGDAAANTIYGWRKASPWQRTSNATKILPRYSPWTPRDAEANDSYKVLDALAVYALLGPSFNFVTYYDSDEDERAVGVKTDNDEHLYITERPGGWNQIIRSTSQHPGSHLRWAPDLWVERNRNILEVLVAMEPSTEHLPLAVQGRSGWAVYAGGPESRKPAELLMRVVAWGLFYVAVLNRAADKAKETGAPPDAVAKKLARLSMPKVPAEVANHPLWALLRPSPKGLRIKGLLDPKKKAPVLITTLWAAKDHHLRWRMDPNTNTPVDPGWMPGPMMDEDGKPVLDEDGEPVMMEAAIEVPAAQGPIELTGMPGPLLPNYSGWITFLGLLRDTQAGAAGTSKDAMIELASVWWGFKMDNLPLLLHGSARERAQRRRGATSSGASIVRVRAHDAAKAIRDVAEASGVSTVTVKSYETGELHNVAAVQLKQLADSAVVEYLDKDGKLLGSSSASANIEVTASKATTQTQGTLPGVADSLQAGMLPALIKAHGPLEVTLPARPPGTVTSARMGSVSGVQRMWVTYEDGDSVDVSPLSPITVKGLTGADVRRTGAAKRQAPPAQAPEQAAQGPAPGGSGA